jgi:hypothetical protein
LIDFNLLNTNDMTKTMNLGRWFAAGVFICCLLLQADGFAQTKTEIKTAKKLFEGYWVNTKAHRHLLIAFDEQDYATINDWHGKMSDDNNTVDAYKAFIKDNKLVMPEDKTDLRSPYCEILKKGNVLLYRCRDMLTNSKQFTDQVWFVREKN